MTNAKALIPVVFMGVSSTLLYDPSIYPIPPSITVFVNEPAPTNSTSPITRGTLATRDAVDASFSPVVNDYAVGSTNTVSFLGRVLIGLLPKLVVSNIGGLFKKTVPVSTN